MKNLIKQKFVENYNLEVSIEEIHDNVDLFGEESPYGLDSMDVLLFINILKKEFNLKIGAINTDSFKTINNIVALIEKQEEKNSITNEN